MSNARARLAILILCLCCVFWGFSFPAMQISAASVDRAVYQGAAALPSMQPKLAIRGMFNGWRFAIAGILLGIVTLRGRYRKNEIVGGIAVGFFFGAGMLFQLSGLLYTLPSISSFLTALSVVFAPIAQAAVLRRAVGPRVWLAVGVAIVGMIILSLGNPGAFTAQTLSLAPPLPHLGQILTILGAVLFTAQILAVDHFGKRADPSRMTTVMLLTAAIVNAAVGMICGAGGQIDHAATWIALAHDSTFIWSFAGLVLVSSVLALWLMNAWQPRISPATAAVVYCMEPVFGTLFSVAFRTEALTGITLTGGAIILVAVLTIARSPQEAAEDRPPAEGLLTTPQPSAPHP